MAAKKTAAVAPDTDLEARGAVDEGQQPAETETSSKTEITVKFMDRGQVTERTFSKEVHGKEFKSLADEFRKKHAARIVA